MNKQEKIFLLDRILHDIRGDWSEFSDLEGRVRKARELAVELELYAHVERIDMYNKERYETGDNDGRAFRAHYTYGGYEGMNVLHGMDYNIDGKSEELIREIYRICSRPEMMFSR